MRNRLYFAGATFLALAHVSPAMAQDDIAAMRQQLTEQQAKIAAQQAQLEEQAKQLEQQAKMLQQFSQRLDEVSGSGPVLPADSGQGAVADANVPPVIAPAAAHGKDSTAIAFEPRDIVGDLNAESVKAGNFPGSFLIPGGKNISLAIGGFVKAVAIADSNAEAMGADFLPASLGTSRTDTDGAFGIDATITRMFIDGRAPVRNGLVRAYVEWDLNSSNNCSLGFKVRHAYGSWNTGHGTLTAGHTWSTFMDIGILPEGLTEPTLSGAIFNRQPLIRWSQPLTKSLTVHLAVEDPNSADVTDFSKNPELNNTNIPDGVVRFQYSADRGHLSLGGLARNLRVELPTGELANKFAWGIHFSGHLEVGQRDNWKFAATYGKGMGRYLLGIQSSAGAAIDPATDTLELRRNWGVLTAFQHHWSDNLRSTAMIGYAHSDPLDWQVDGTFIGSIYASSNLFWQILPYLNLGIEYDYGKRYNLGPDDLDNHRVAFGFQIF